MDPRISVVIPARDEERYIGACLDSIAAAAGSLDGGEGEVESIVVVNRCTDGTEAIARERGARIVHDDSKNLAALRNAGARQARGEILLTVDADSRLHPATFREVVQRLETGRYIGGAVLIKLERLSLGLILTMLALLPLLLWYRISGGSFWLYRRDFEALGGFDEDQLSFEDVEFARRLKRHGRRQGKRFKVLLGTPVVTSCRKFDALGDWYLLLRPRLFLRLLRGRDRELADRLWYDAER